MEEILKIEVLEREKSRYHIELLKASNGKIFISISQHIFSKLHEIQQSTIRMKPADLEEMINILKGYQSEIPKIYPRKKALTNVRREELINRYLNKCLEIEMLAVQFDCSVAEIKQILFEKNIVITSNSIDNNKPVKRFWRRKRRRSE